MNPRARGYAYFGQGSAMVQGLLERVDPITSFSGSYRFLSNFYPSPIILYGLHFATVEHAFQAMKMTTDADAELVRSQRTPADAKRIARRSPCREDWDSVKQQAMYTALKEKFAIEHLAQRLRDTGNRTLVEGNDWGDQYWGVCNGKGENWLGILLMKVRSELVL